MIKLHTLAIISISLSISQEQNVTLLQAKNDLFLQLQSEGDTLTECEEKIVNLVQQKAEYENQVGTNNSE